MPRGIYKRIEGKHYGMSGKKHSQETIEKLRKAASGLIGQRARNWKGGKTIDANGYVWIYKPEHPNAIRGKYVFEHRLVMEKKLGRYLKMSEEVHHINGNKLDNRIENLQLFNTKSKHRKNEWKDKEYRKNGENNLKKARKYIGKNI